MMLNRSSKFGAKKYKRVFVGVAISILLSRTILTLFQLTNSSGGDHAGIATTPSQMDEFMIHPPPRSTKIAAGNHAPGKKINKIKTLVTTHLPAVLGDSRNIKGHYQNYLGPSWKRLVEENRRNTGKETVLPDFFIACVDDGCDQIDKELCTPLPMAKNEAGTIDKQMLRNFLVNDRHDKNRMLCYYAHVPERKNQDYIFIHSLNFLEMEPLTSILDVGYYDYILRTDADALLFPGLLNLAPSGSGWIGAGEYGEEGLTDHLVRHFSETLLGSELGKPLRSATASPSMQSTFYIHTSVFQKFVSTLILATNTLYWRAFDRKEGGREGVCANLGKFLNMADHYENITQQLMGRKCDWPLWMKGVASLYGTRIAADYVLDNLTVTLALDALATPMNSVDRSIYETIQVHLLVTKKIYNEHSPDVNICTMQTETIRRLRSSIARNAGSLKPWSDTLLNAMETISNSTSMVPKTIHHETAAVFLKLFREQHGCNWTHPNELWVDENLTQHDDNTKVVTVESYEAVLKEIEWSNKKAAMFQKDYETKVEYEKEYDSLIHRPIVKETLDKFFCSECAFTDKASCGSRKSYFVTEKHKLPSVAHLYVMKYHPQCVREKAKEKSSVSLDAFCGNCKFLGSKMTCSERLAYLMRAYSMEEEDSKESLLDQGYCADPEYAQKARS